MCRSLVGSSSRLRVAPRSRSRGRRPEAQPPPEPGTALENSADGVVQVSALDAVALQVGVYFGDDGKAFGETVDAGDVSAGMSCQADLSAVAGKTVAFTSESSTSGALFPKLQLIIAGIDPDADIDVVYTGSHDAAVTAVYNGDADIGLAYDDARRSIRKSNPDVGDRVIVFNITDDGSSFRSIGR